MNKRLEYVDLIRAFFCIAILLYHMTILKGGYLAVCSFFALSGYLSSMSMKKNDFSLLKYYKTRLLRVYLPMVIVVLSSLGICLVLLPDVVWVSMKREVISLLLGYNNFWQLSANLDYFARHVDSPYMHFWYVAILIQLDLVFPLILGLFKLVKKGFKKYAPAVFACVFGIASLIYFIYLHQSKGLMFAYYNTLCRAFSWFFGMMVGLIHIERTPLLLDKIKGKAGEIGLFLCLMILQSILFVCAPADSKLYLLGMILTTVIACRLLEYAKSIERPLPEAFMKLVDFISTISYEIYLVQYPVIYLFQYVKMDRWLSYICVILIVIVIATLLHAAIDLLTRKTSFDVISLIVLVAFLVASLYGGYRFAIAKDLQAEMERLEKELALEQEEQERRQKEYEEQIRLEEEERAREEERIEQEREAAQDDIDTRLAEIEKQEKYLWEGVESKHICFIGDSVMLGASPSLYEVFPNCYVDAQTNRTAYKVNGIVSDLKKSRLLGNPVVISCGANGDCPDNIKDEIMETLSDREVFWMTTPNNPTANENIIAYAGWYPNLHIIDWATISQGHDEYFAGDGLHLEGPGKEAYALAIKQSLYDYYSEDLEKEKQALEEERKALEETNTEETNIEIGE